MAWNRLCYPKGMGGMGFRDMHVFNLALLGRQVWRLVNFKDTLCFKVLSAKYFPEVFRPKRCDRPSFTWMSIAKTAAALKEGYLWQVGDGSTITIRWDQWGIEGLNGNSLDQSKLNNDERRVKDLWNQKSKRWKSARVIELYGKSMGEHIWNLTIPHNDIKDSLTWIQNPHGFYTTKSAYSWLSLNNLGFGPHRFFWKIIWMLKMLPKVKVFSWRIGHDILPTYDNIGRIHQNFSTTCPRCKNSAETLIHALKDCPKVREVLITGGLNNRLPEGRYDRCIDWNKMVFQGKEDPTRVVWERAQALSNEFRIFNLNNPPVIPPKPSCKGWKKPLKDFVKINNVDAASSDGGVGYGVITRDADGFVLGGCYGFANKTLDVIWAEFEALSMGLKLADSMKIPRLIVESDNATLINTANKRVKDVTILGQCINKECKILKNFDSVLFNWIDRRSNEVADSLSKLAIKNNCNLKFKMDYPLEIHNVIIREAIK
ncbi:hypothetical protein CXB51_010097 [Gossypium anomalum]|uniref:RNase H type-1 domain-containing protein n=1 Tax=Gossypium anomalum TaxID=47600 RepID=A0A8J6D3Y5_9ROSI|nr:hypothetical protein CXB51_010097 [Gossypium anomalum]